MTYDTYGNIVSKNGQTYFYDSTWHDLLTGIESEFIEYDAQGNPTKYLGHTLTWEKGRQLKSFDNNTYIYNANGIRTSKTINGVKHEYILDGTKILRETWGENTLIPIYNDEESVCGIIYNGTPHYFLKNMQDDIVAIANSNGEVEARYSYDAWGAVTSAVTYTELTKNVDIATINPFRYRGYYYDEDNGLYYLQSRYFDASVGRFINVDDCEILIINNSLIGTNIFCYCNNYPVNSCDYDGRELISGTLVMSILSAIIKVLVVLLAAWCIGALIQKLIGLFSKSLSSSEKSNILPITRIIIQTLCTRVETLKDKTFTSIQKLYQAIIDLTASIAQSYLKALDKIKNNQFHLHHIVAQSSLKATLARSVLYSIGWDTNNLFNTIWLSQRLHSSLHTNAYYAAINAIFLSAYTKSRKDRVNYIIAIYITIHTILYSFDACL